MAACKCGSEVETVADDSDLRLTAVILKKTVHRAVIGIVHRLGEDGVIVPPLGTDCLNQLDCEAKKQARQLVSP